MPIKIGSTGISAIYKGSIPAIKMYKGSELVYELVEEETNPLKALIERTIKKVDTEFSDDLTSIGIQAFYGCSSLKSITIPESVTIIGYSAFENCSSLTTITIPSSVTSIGIDAFKGSNLTSVFFEDGFLAISNSSFQGCTNLTQVTIPSSVTSIGVYAFSNCSSLTTITIPSSVTSIGDYAFLNCSNLTTMTVLAITPATLGSNAISSATTTIYVPAGTKTIYESASGWSTLLTRETNPVTFVELS